MVYFLLGALCVVGNTGQPIRSIGIYLPLAQEITVV